MTVLWNEGYKQIGYDRPDIIIKNKRDKICLQIDVAIPLGRNII
jgi:hypothetical protein